MEAYSEGGYSIHKIGELFAQEFVELSMNNEFYRIFVELSVLVKKKKQTLDDIIKDSKNYKGRFSANIKYDSLHVFFEEFNYEMPERNEYYLMEWINGKYILSVSKESMFMEEYLSKEEYYSHYGASKARRISFVSMDEIDEYYKNNKVFFYPDLLSSRKRTFSRMKNIVMEKLDAIRNKKILIQNFDSIFDNPGDVLLYYKVEQEFGCIRDKEQGEIDFYLAEATIKDENGIDVLITFDDLREAFELGIGKKEDVCRIKRKYGSIINILKQ